MDVDDDDDDDDAYRGRPLIVVGRSARSVVGGGDGGSYNRIHCTEMCAYTRRSGMWPQQIIFPHQLCLFHSPVCVCVPDEDTARTPLR